MIWMVSGIICYFWQEHYKKASLKWLDWEACESGHATLLTRLTKEVLAARKFHYQNRSFCET